LGFSRTNADRIGLASNTDIADIDVVTARREFRTGKSAYRSIKATGRIPKQRRRSERQVANPGGIVTQRGQTICRIIAAGAVAKECVNAVRRIVAPGVAGKAARERVVTDRRVVAAGSVGKKRLKPGSGVGDSGRDGEVAIGLWVGKFETEVGDMKLKHAVIAFAIVEFVVVVVMVIYGVKK